MIQQIYPSVTHNFLYELNKDMQFSAAHCIPHELAGKCQNIHGHTYFVNVTIVGDELDETGFLINFQMLKQLVHGKFDHTVMNDHSEFSNTVGYDFPSTEAVARKIWEMVEGYLQTLKNKPTCVQVFVRETPTTYVVYRPKRT